MNTSTHLRRASLPALIGLGLIAVAMTLFGAWPARGTGAAAPIGVNDYSAPHEIQAAIAIPAGKAANIDAACTDYGDGASFNFSDAFGVTGTVYLKHDGANLYVCLRGANGTDDRRFASVYLDTDNGREAYAQGNDLALRINFLSQATSAFKGTGIPNGYTPTLLSGWSAAASVVNNADEAEYKIPLSLTGGWCGQPFGLAVYHHWVQGVGNDYGWPSNKFFDQPRTWQEAMLASAPCGSGKIAYVYKRDTATAGEFKALLESNGFAVQLVPMSAITTTSFKPFDLIIVADDTGNLNDWGAASQVSPLTADSKPIVGLGEGGYAFFGKLGSALGWPNGWHGPQADVLAADSALTYYHTPYDLSPALPGPFPLYAQPVNEVGIYLPKPLPPVTPIGLEPPSPDHAPLINDDAPTGALGCYQLWGYSGGPSQMAVNGKRLFVNAVTDALRHQCPLPPPPTTCLSISKSAAPPNGSFVQPGDVITYTITYTVSAGCTIAEGKVMDRIPLDTAYVPGSATGGISPNFDETLVWPFTNLGAGTYTQKFKVLVLDRQCVNQRRVNNIARLVSSGGNLDSNTVTHPVTCPPVTFPNPRDPPYAEQEIEIYPYPLMTGRLTKVSVRLVNPSAQAQTVTVTFQTSPNRFGIGLPFAALPVAGNPRVVTIPAGGSIQVMIDWIPVSSGHYCLQVMVEGNGFKPIYTQRNLDVTEDLRPGIQDTLPFSVGNPSAVAATIQLVVVNTCPGWLASVAPATLLNVGPNGTDIRSATLYVTPPALGLLGTACHIDVEGWIGDRQIGGLRKLDVPPVHLPRANPPWEEKEIIIRPEPPTAGVPVSYCIELQNPLPFSRTVTLVYHYANFGAGLGFTPIQTRTVTLPPNSLDKYCISWTAPLVSSLHYCLMVTLKQPGFQDQHSQRNIDFRRPPVLGAGGVSSFSVGNPFPYTRTLRLVPTLIGIGPQWVPDILPDPPPFLGPNQAVNLQFILIGLAHGNLAPNATDDRFGDYSSAEVAVYLDDELIGGFSVDYTPIKVFLPLVMKQ